MSSRFYARTVIIILPHAVLDVVAGLYRETWAVFDQRDVVLGEVVEGIDELIDIGFQGIEFVDVRTFVERVKRGK